MKNIELLKNHFASLKRLKKWNSYGYFGEYLYKMVKIEQGSEVLDKHKQGIDFIIDNLRSVDVKTRMRIEFKKSNRYSRATLTPNDREYFAYVIFFDDVTCIIEEDENRNLKEIKSLSWDEVLSFYNQYLGEKSNSTISRVKPGAEDMYRKEIISDLKKWLKLNFDLGAKILYTHNKEEQNKWTLRGCGPVSFFHKNEDKFDLIILVYLDGVSVYDVYAYPGKLAQHKNSIQWQKFPIKSDVDRTTFDPKILQSIYKFKDVDDFKKSFYHRFFTK